MAQTPIIRENANEKLHNKKLNHNEKTLDPARSKQLIEGLLDEAEEQALNSASPTVVAVEIQGILPLLQDKLPDEFFVELLEGSRRPDGIKSIGGTSWKKSVYYDKNGLVCQPAGHIEASMCEAAGEFPIRGKGKKSYRRLIESTAFVYPNQLIPHQIQQLEVLTAAVPATGMGGGKRPKIYPKLETGWKLKFFLALTSHEVPQMEARNILERAGRMYGIGAWRKRHGRFVITSWQPIKEPEA